MSPIARTRTTTRSQCQARQQAKRFHDLTSGAATPPVRQGSLVPGYPVQGVKHAAVPPLLILGEFAVRLPPAHRQFKKTLLEHITTTIRSLRVGVYRVCVCRFSVPKGNRHLSLIEAKQYDVRLPVRAGLDVRGVRRAHSYIGYVCGSTTESSVGHT